jgi:hypothetical protein
MYGEHWTERPPLEGDLENFRNNGLSKGFDDIQRLHPGKKDGANPPETPIDSSALHALLAMNVSMMGKKYFLEHYLCGVGNPVGPEVMGETLTYSDLMAVHNAWQIHRHIPDPDRIVEIGPGFGALAAILRGIYPNAEIVLIDLPEHRAITEYYLEETVGLENITITTELPDGADVVIALRCMMEMPMSEVTRYIEWIQKNDVSWFYLVNRYMKKNVTKWYPFDHRWLPVVSRCDYITGVIHEFLLERMANPMMILNNQLETLPPFIHQDKALSSSHSFAIGMKGQLKVDRYGNQ